MSSCWTLTHNGLTEGIETVGTGQPHDPRHIALGEEWQLNTDGAKPRLVRTPTIVRFDSNKPPRNYRDGRLLNASVKMTSPDFCLEHFEPNDNEALVLIDTGHTALCKTGGYWEFPSGVHRGEAIGIAQGRVGHALYQTSYNVGRSSHHTYEVHEDTCYEKGLVLVPPGSQLTVVFHAPGSLTGVLRYMGNQPEFFIETNDVDPNYTYRHPCDSLRLDTIPPELL